MSRPKRVSLRGQAEASSLNALPTGRHLSEAKGDHFEKGEIHGVRLRAYYPPTRDLWTVSDFLRSMTWSDAKDQAAVSAELEFDNSDGQVGKYLNRPGMIYFLETRAASGGFSELLRLVAWTTSVTDLIQGTLSVTAYDHLMYLQNAQVSVSYTKDKRHPRGWTASEIAVDLCRRYKIPILTRRGQGRGKALQVGSKGTAVRSLQRKVGVRPDGVFGPDTRQALERAQGKKDIKRDGVAGATTLKALGLRQPRPARRPVIARTTYRIARYVQANISLYEALNGAYVIDGQKTGKSYIVEAKQGRVLVRRASTKRVLAIADGSNLRSASFSRDVTEAYGTVNLGKGEVDKDGKPQRSKEKTRPQRAASEKSAAKKTEGSRKQDEARARRTETRARGRGEAPEREGRALEQEGRLASSMLFGSLEYRGERPNSTRDPDWSRKVAQATTDRLARAQKTLSVTADGNAMVRYGDRVFVRVPFSAAQRFRKEMFISSGSWSLSPGDFSMELECVWREKELIPEKEKEEADAEGAEAEEPAEEAAA